MRVAWTNCKTNIPEYDYFNFRNGEEGSRTSIEESVFPETGEVWAFSTGEQPARIIWSLGRREDDFSVVRIDTLHYGQLASCRLRHVR